MAKNHIYMVSGNTTTGRPVYFERIVAPAAFAKILRQHGYDVQPAKSWGRIEAYNRLISK